MSAFGKRLNRKKFYVYSTAHSYSYSYWLSLKLKM